MDVQAVLKAGAAEYGYEKLAKETGLHRSAIYRWLAGSDPSFTTLEKIAVALGRRFTLEEIPNVPTPNSLSISTRPVNPRD